MTTEWSLTGLVAVLVFNLVTIGLNLYGAWYIASLLKDER